MSIDPAPPVAGAAAGPAGTTSTGDGTAGTVPETAAERIAEVGFKQWLDELQARKREELRQRLLAEMGLTPEMLEAMDASARARIEAMVEQKIAERAAAEHAGEATEARREGAAVVAPGGRFARLDATMMRQLFGALGDGDDAPPAGADGRFGARIDGPAEGGDGGGRAV